MALSGQKQQTKIKSLRVIPTHFGCLSLALDEISETGNGPFSFVFTSPLHFPNYIHTKLLIWILLN